MSVENPFSDSPKPRILSTLEDQLLTLAPEQREAEEAAARDTLIAAELGLTRTLAPSFETAEVDTYPGSERVYVQVRCTSEADFTLVLELLSLLDIDAEYNPADFSLKIDNSFDIETLRVKGILSLTGRDNNQALARALTPPFPSFALEPEESGGTEAAWPLKNKQSLPELFRKSEERISVPDPFDEQEEESGNMQYGDVEYLRRQSAKKYFREAGSLFRRTPLGNVPVSEEEQALLLAAAQAGDKKARHDLLSLNMELVYFSMYNFSRRFPWVNQGDLLQEGLIQMNLCIDRYRKEEPAEFSTYAALFMEWAMARFLQKNRPHLHIPLHHQESIGRLNRRERAHLSQYGHKMDVPSVARALAISQSEARALVQLRDEVYAAEFIDIESEAGIDIAETLPSEESVLENVVRNNMLQVLPRVIDALTPSEARVIRLRFGIDVEGEPMNVDAISRELGLSRSRIRRIEARAVQKLQAVSAPPPIKDFLEPTKPGLAYDPLRPPRRRV